MDLTTCEWCEGVKPVAFVCLKMRGCNSFGIMEKGRSGFALRFVDTIQLFQLKIQLVTPNVT